MHTLSTEARTDAAPFTPHNHGVSAPARLAASFIPSGNAIPIISPAGKQQRHRRSNPYRRGSGHRRAHDRRRRAPKSSEHHHQRQPAADVPARVAARRSIARPSV